MRTHRDLSLSNATAVAIAIGVALWTATAAAQSLTLGDRPQPTEKEVVEMLGQPLAKIFAKFGAPTDVLVDSPKSKSPAVLIDYGLYSFVVLNKTVTECDFWPDWPGTAQGVKIGSMVDDVVKQLGKANVDVKNANGTRMMVWNRKDDTKLNVTFDKDGKSDGLMLQQSK